MKNLFIHLFTKGIEHYGDSEIVLKEIFAILDSPEEVLLKNLQDAFQQAHRKRLLRENGVGLSHDDIQTALDHDSLPESLLKELLKNQVTIEQLSKFIKNQIENHDKTKTLNRNSGN